MNEFQGNQFEITTKLIQDSFWWHKVGINEMIVSFLFYYQMKVTALFIIKKIFFFETIFCAS